MKVKRGYHGAIAPLKVEIGRTYNFLTVVKPLRKEKRVGTIYECLCECGNVTEANATQLVRGNKKSCGCFARKVSRENMIAVHESKGRKIHDMHGTRLHSLWRAMISRCTYTFTLSNRLSGSGKVKVFCWRYKLSPLRRQRHYSVRQLAGFYHFQGLGFVSWIFRRTKHRQN